jgi:hypothetical protein
VGKNPVHVFARDYVEPARQGFFGDMAPDVLSDLGGVRPGGL